MEQPKKMEEIYETKNLPFKKRSYYDFAAGHIPGNNPASNDAKRPRIDLNVPLPTHESDLEISTTEKPHTPEQEQMTKLVNDIKIKTLINLKKAIINLRKNASWACSNLDTCLSLYQDLNALINFKKGSKDVSRFNVLEAMNRIIIGFNKIPTASPHIEGFLSEVKRIRQIDDTDSSSHLDEAERVQQRDQVQSGSSSNRQKEQIEHIPLKEGAFDALKELETISIKRSKTGKSRLKNDKLIYMYWRDIRDKIGDVLFKNFNKQNYINDVKKLKIMMEGDNATPSMKELYEEKLKSFFPDL